MKDIDYFSARKRLAILWVIGGSILVFVFALQLAGSRYDGIYQEACGWFLPNIIPILSLVITGFYSEMNKNNSSIKIPKAYLNIASYLSVVYLLLFLFVIFSFTNSKGNVIDYYNHWNILLGPVQGLASASIGAFFLKHSRTNSKLANTQNR